jgi:Na+-driven multidrug efflux pump
MWGMLFSSLCVFVPVALASLALDFGIVGVWCGLLGLIGARLTTCAWRFRGRRWAIVGATRAPA